MDFAGAFKAEAFLTPSSAERHLAAAAEELAASHNLEAAH